VRLQRGGQLAAPAGYGSGAVEAGTSVPPGACL
jgi:hypothetical protein